MNKNEFSSYLQENLKEYPNHEVSKSIEFYIECIDDRIEDGMSEEEAVSALGDLNTILQNIKLEMPLPVRATSL